MDLVKGDLIVPAGSFWSSGFLVPKPLFGNPVKEAPAS